MRLHDYHPAAHDTRELFTSQGMEDDLAIKLALVRAPSVQIGHQSANEVVAQIQERKAIERQLAKVTEKALAGELKFATDPQQGTYLH